MGIGKADNGAEYMPSFRAAIWARMAAMDIGSPYALAKLLHGRVSEEALHSYLCEGTELSADKIEAVFNLLGIGLALTPESTPALTRTHCRYAPICADTCKQARKAVPGLSDLRRQRL